MSIQEQSIKLPVINIDDLIAQEEEKPRRHGVLLPNSMRALIIGPSACGKTNALVTLIIHPNGLKFSTVYLYTKSHNQAKYTFLKELLESVEGIKLFIFTEHETVINPEEALPNAIIIFDDIACEKQDNVRSYFCMGRHKNVDSFYLNQSYAKIPKHLIRDNANFLVLFRQDEMNLKHVYNDHVNTDMDYKDFKNLCLKCWNEKFGFLVIDKDSELNSGRYRQGFDKFFSINNQ